MSIFVLLYLQREVQTYCEAPVGIIRTFKNCLKSSYTHEDAAIIKKEK